MIVTRAAHQPDSETMQSELPGFRPEFSHLVTLARAEHPAGFHVMDTGPALEAQGLPPPTPPSWPYTATPPGRICGAHCSTPPTTGPSPTHNDTQSSG